MFKPDSRSAVPMLMVVLLLSPAGVALLGGAAAGPADDVGPLADTSSPVFVSAARTPSFPGPTSVVDVTATVRDESSPLSVSIHYGYDNSTWTTVSATTLANTTATDDVRNPTSGTTYSTLTAQYDAGCEISYLHVNIYSSDHDTCWVRVRGYRASTSTWTNLYYSTSTNDGVKVAADLSGQGFTRWDIHFYDTEHNDATYYNATYRSVHQNYRASIPAAGSNPKVYYKFNASDAGGYYTESQVYNYTLDTTAPVVNNMTLPASIQHTAVGIAIHTNVSDDLALGTVYLNYSTDGSTWHLLPMVNFSGTSTAAEYRALLPPPSSNTTMRIRVEAYDSGGNHNNSTTHTFVWDPPPEITGLAHSPANPNHQVKVNVSATVTDGDGLSKVVVRYSTDNSTWSNATTSSVGSVYYAELTAGLGTPWVYYWVWANDTSGGENRTGVQRYYVDRNSPRIFTPSHTPTYPNASAPVWVSANVSDNLGLSSVVVQYSTDGGSTWSNASMSQASSVGSLTVGGHVRSSSSSYLAGLALVGGELGTWDSSVSGYGGTPSPSLYTDVDVVLLDGSGGSFQVNEAMAAARAGKLVVTTYSIFASVRSALGSPSYTMVSTHTFDTWGLSLGRGAVVMTYDLYNRNYMGYSYNYYSASVRADLVAHLEDVHEAFMPHSGAVPATGTSTRVLYRIVATDISGLKVTTTNYEYTTDGVAPTVVDSLTPPTPPGWDQSQAFPVWVSFTDDVYIGGATLHYSIDGGSTWSSAVMTLSTGNSTAANYTGFIPATGSSTWVYYYYVVSDRAGNAAKDPSVSRYAYQTSDGPSITLQGHSPLVGSASTPVTVSATITDPDVVAVAEVHYRLGTSGAWSTVSAVAGTNDLWSRAIPAPSTSGMVYYYFTARDTVGVWTTSATASYRVDATPPVLALTGTSPQYPSATSPTLVTGTAVDEGHWVSVGFQYRYGASGTVSDLTASGPGTTSHSERKPSSGTQYGGTLSATHDLGGILVTLNVYIYSSDHDTCYLRVRGYNASTDTWTNIYYGSYTNDGTKVNANLLSYGYSRWDILYYDSEYNDGLYYSASWTVRGNTYNATVPAPGYSTWVYYRIKATDAAGNQNESAWARYWADGTLPSLATHRPPASPSTDSSVTVAAGFIDDSAVGRAEVHYSFGGSYTSVDMTDAGNSDATHLNVTGSVPASLVPYTVRYFFRVYDAAGNHNDSATFTYTTVMPPVSEGTRRTYDASRLDTTAGYKAWEWDFDYAGTFAADDTGVSASHRYMDNGTYTVALRLTDNNDAVTLHTFTVAVTDLSPVAAMTHASSSHEGVNVSLDASSSSSWPDAIASYEWDFDHDGTTFHVDATGDKVGHVFMDNGTFTIALRVTDDDGSVDVVNSTIVIQDLSPVVDVDAPRTVDEGEAFDLNASASWSWPDDLASFEWDLDYESPTFDVDGTGAVVNHTYMDDGRYFYAVRVYDDDGSFTLEVGRVTVRDLSPTADIDAPASFDEGQTVTFNASASTSYPDDIVAFEWDLHHQGTFDVEFNGEAVDFTYMDDGTYNVALRVRDDDGSIDIATLTVTVADLSPVAVLDGPSSVLEGEEFVLNASLSTSYPDDIVSYEWDLDYDGVQFDVDTGGMAGWQTYMDDGNYTVALRVRDDDGSTALATLDIAVLDREPAAAFEAAGTFDEGDPVMLWGNMSTSYPDEIVSWEWDLDYQLGEFDFDATGPVVNHTYMDDGSYTVLLRVTDDDGSVSLTMRVIRVRDLGPAAVLNWRGHPLKEDVWEGDLVRFNASSSSSYPDGIVAYEWWWEADGELVPAGDNTTLSGTFHSPGDHTVHLLVRDDDGSEDVVNVTITVMDLGPTAALGVHVVEEGEEELLDASGSHEPGMDIVAYRWDLDGDGEWDEVTTNSTLVRVWTSPGNYVIALEVEDEDGSTDLVNATLVVTNVAPVACAGGPYTVDEGELIALSAVNCSDPGGDIALYIWDVDGDGEEDANTSVPVLEWSWDLAGVYSVTLWAEDTDGSRGVAFANVTVVDLPPAVELALPAGVTEGQEAAFAVLSVHDPGTEEFGFEWHFGDGGSAIGRNVTHVYLDDGVYEGHLVIVDNDGGEHVLDWSTSMVVANVAPQMVMEVLSISAVEDEPLTYRFEAYDVVDDTVTWSIEGPGGEIDPGTGEFTWTPLDEDTGPNTFTVTLTDEDGGEASFEVTVDVQDVDNDSLLGMSSAGGSSLILLLLVIIVVVAVVLYVRWRRGAEGEGEYMDGEGGSDVVVVGGPGGGQGDDAAVAPVAAPPAYALDVPAEEAPRASHGGEVEPASEDLAQDPNALRDDFKTIPTLPDGAQLTDKGHGAELDADEETELGGESEWEIVD